VKKAPISVTTAQQLVVNEILSNYEKAEKVKDNSKVAVKVAVSDAKPVAESDTKSPETKLAVTDSKGEATSAPVVKVEREEVGSEMANKKSSSVSPQPPEESKSSEAEVVKAPTSSDVAQKQERQDTLSVKKPKQRPKSRSNSPANVGVGSRSVGSLKGSPSRVKMELLADTLAAKQQSSLATAATTLPGMRLGEDKYRIVYTPR